MSSGNQSRGSLKLLVQVVNICVLAGFLLFSSSALASDLGSLTEEEQLSLLNLMAAGNQAFDDGDHAGACDYYFEASQILEFADLYYRLADCNERLGNFEEAAAAYRRYLELDEEIPDRRRIEREIERLEQVAASMRVGRVNVSSEPVGISVYIDDRDGELLGETPLQAELSPGEYQLLLVRRGVPDQRRIVRIEPGQTVELDVTMIESSERNWLLLSGLGTLGLTLAAGGATGYLYYQAETLAQQANSYSRSSPENRRSDLRAIEEDAVAMQRLTIAGAAASGVLLVTSATLIMAGRSGANRDGDLEPTVFVFPSPNGGAYAGFTLRF